MFGFELDRNLQRLFNISEYLIGSSDENSEVHINYDDIMATGLAESREEIDEAISSLLECGAAEKLTPLAVLSDINTNIQ